MIGSAPLRLAVFDMDGVIFEGGNFWLDLHRRYGTEKSGQALADQYLTSDYARLAELVGGVLWKGMQVAPYRELVKERQFHPGIAEVFSYLRQRSLSTAILSSGPDLLALRAQAELGVDMVRANGLEIEDDILTGNVAVSVPDAEKSRVGLEIVKEFGVEPENVVFVGDSESDAAFAKLVGLSVAYNSSSENLRRVCDFELGYGELKRLINILQRHGVNPPTRDVCRRGD